MMKWIQAGFQKDRSRNNMEAATRVEDPESLFQHQ